MCSTPGKYPSIAVSNCVLLSALFLATATLLSVFPSIAHSSGLETSGIGGRGRSMGYALTAIADGWSALYYNPAGLSHLVTTQNACTYEIFYGTNTSSSSLQNLGISQSPDPYRGDFLDPIGDEPSTFSRKNVGSVVHAGEFGWGRGNGRFGWALGLFGSGAGSTWDDSISTSSGDDLDAEISYENISINVPVGAGMRITDRFSFGGAVTLRYGLLNARYGKTRQGALPYRLLTDQRTSGLAMSADLGFSYDLSGDLSLGAVWRMPYRVRKRGDTTIENSLLPLSHSSSTDVTEEIPSRYSLGMAFIPYPDHLLGFSVSFLEWSDYERNTTYNAPLPGILIDSSGNPSRWEDTVVVNLGYEMPLSGNWDLRWGLVYDQAPEPVSYRSMVGGQTIDVWKVTLGAGRTNKLNDLDLGYVHTYGPGVNGYIPGAVYRMALHELFVAYTW